MRWSIGTALSAAWVAGGLVAGSLQEDAGAATLALLGIPGAVAGAAAALVAFTPPRHGSARVRFPWRRAGHVLFAAGPVLAVAVLVSGNGIGRAIQAAVVCTALGMAALRLADRAAARAYDEVAASDPRPPVLYLRGFAAEGEVFARRPGWWWSGLRRHSYVLTLEDYLGRAVGQRIGPLVALANPEDYVPRTGAARVYARDEDWRRRVEDLAARARCIVAIAAPSPGMRWELEHLLRAHLLGKLFFLTPLAGDRRRARAWEATLAALREAGYDGPDEEPGPGAVLGVDDHARLVVLARDRREPAAIADVIARALTDPAPRP